MARLSILRVNAGKKRQAELNNSDLLVVMVEALLLLLLLSTFILGVFILTMYHIICGGMWWRRWLRHCEQTKRS
jgi:hypothetical protein